MHFRKCRNCQAYNDGDALYCVKCGEVLDAPLGSSRDVPSHLFLAIFATICGFVPFGIAAIVYASRVKPKLESGDYEGALVDSGKASFWGWLSVALVILIPIVFFLIAFAIAGVKALHL